MRVVRQQLAGILFWALVGACTATAAGAQSVRTMSAASDELATLASGEKARLEGVEVEGSKVPLTFALERFEVFTPDATVTVHGDGGSTQVLPAPGNRYFRGTVEGEPDSRVFLAVLQNGTTQGIVHRESGDLAFIGGDEATQAKESGPLLARKVNPLFMASSGADGFTCDDASRSLRTPGADPGATLFDPQNTALSQPLAAPLPTRTARVAIETDFEFYGLFNSVTNATNYIGNVIGYDSAVAYIPELSTSLEVSSISLWNTSSDPWTQTSPFCGLMEFGKYWNANRAGVSRSIAHFMSGKSLGGGVAWLNALCQSAFATHASASCPGLGSEVAPNWGGDYGFTASISGSFNVDSPGVLWDIMATAHEIGHNFGSPHSHCYNGLLSDPNPIDKCFSGGECQTYDQQGNCVTFCYSGTTSLPGPPGAGSGTIMSYCHLVSPGMSNISMTFGAAPGFSFGDQPNREASLMNSYLATVPAACLTLAGPAISSISPATGSFAGGQSVTITGARFANGATVTIGGIAATSVVVQSSTTITAVTPAHGAGTVTVVVNNPAVTGVSNGNAMLLNGYVYTLTPPAPVVTSVAPPSGPLAGGTVVTITGNNFVSGATATFAGAPAVATTFVNGSTLTATTPANTAGTKSVTVTNPDASNGNLANGFFYANAGAAVDFFTVTPCRMVDTRGATGALGGPVLAANNSVRLFTLAKNPNVCGIPATAKALSLNVTADSATAAGTLALYPGNAFPLGTSTVSYKAGVTRANNVVMELSTDGSGTIGVQNASTGTVQLIIDVNGYFQ